MLQILVFMVATVLGTHPATNPNAKLLTVEETENQAPYSVYPERVRLFWDENNQLSKTFSMSRAKLPNWTLPESDDPNISYGQSVSRNEFGSSTGVFPSPDGNKIAVYRKDESKVTLYPMYDITPRTGGNKWIKYPMAGMDSEKLAVCICDTKGNILTELQVTDFSEERYLTNVTWSPDSKYVFVQVLDREQHNMHLNMYRADNGAFIRTILKEHNEAWVEPLDKLYFIKDSYDFLYRTDNRDGYKNLYLCDTLGVINRVTPCAADVEYLDNDGKYIYYTSAEVSPIENHLFRVRLRGRRIGKPERLTHEEGWHTITLSPDCSKFIDRYSSLNVPGVTAVKKADGTLIETILTALDPLAEYAQCQVELGSVKSADGKFNNYYRLYYPRDFDPNKKYPLIVYVYGGPHSQMVTNSYLGGVRMWEMLMAQKGYVVYAQDNRGTSNQGAAFEKAINRQCGVAEMEDQMHGLKTLLGRCPWIDSSRIGVHGWSYGGFMTLSLATHYPQYFKVAVAGGPVIDWKWYEVMYGERYMDRPQTNPEGFEKTSLIPMADKLSARTLICQGTLDDTVVWQHSLSFLQECIVAEKKIDYFPYPIEPHNMRRRARVHLYEKITDYFETYL